MTRTVVTYFNADTVEGLQHDVDALETNLQRRAPFMPGEHYVEALDRIDAVRLAVKRLADVVPE